MKEYNSRNKLSKFQKLSDFSFDSGLYLSSKNYHCLAFVDKKPDAGIICHEAVHFANHIMDLAGIKMDGDNDEPQAYLVEWVVDRIWELTRGAK